MGKEGSPEIRVDTVTSENEPAASSSDAPCEDIGEARCSVIRYGSRRERSRSKTELEERKPDE